MEIHRDDHPTHLAADLHELLAEEVGELGVRAEVSGKMVLLHGTVATPERAEEVERVVARALPGFHLDNRLQILAEDMEPVTSEEHL